MVFAEERPELYFTIDFLKSLVENQFILLQGNLVSSLPAAYETGLRTDIWEFTKDLTTRFVLSHIHNPFGLATQLVCPRCGYVRSTKKLPADDNSESFIITCKTVSCPERYVDMTKPPNLQPTDIKHLLGTDAQWYSSKVKWDDLIRQAKSEAG